MNNSAAREKVTPSAQLPQHSSSPGSQRGMGLVVGLLTLSVLINYVDRSNLSIAAPLLKDELHISNTQLGTLLAAFFWTYGMMQIPAGWLVDRFDVKWVFAAGFFIWSSATAITGLLHGFAALIAVRVILGFGESVAFPSYSNILGTYFSEVRRGFPNALVMAGLSLGPAVGILVGGTVVARFGWRPFFFVLGLGGLLWLIPWLAIMPRKPAASSAPRPRSIGIPMILRQRAAWGTCLGQFSINYFLYFLLTWLPSYLNRGRHFTLQQVGIYGGLLFLMSAIAATTWGKIADRLVNAGATATQARTVPMIVGHVAIGIALVFTVLAHGPLFILMLALTGACLGVSCCSSWAVTQTLAGPYACGRWTGVQNFVGNMAGWVAPALTGFLLDRTGSFFWPFFITGIVAWMGAVAWGPIVGRLVPVDWERLDRESGMLPKPTAPALS